MGTINAIIDLAELTLAHYNYKPIVSGFGLFKSPLNYFSLIVRLRRYLPNNRDDLYPLEASRVPEILNKRSEKVSIPIVPRYFLRLHKKNYWKLQ